MTTSGRARHTIGSGDLASDQNAVDTGTGSDTVYGCNASDFVTTHSAVSPDGHRLRWRRRRRPHRRSWATDELYGGPGNDYLVAETGRGVRATPRCTTS